jgi:hypothetical protein
LFEQTKTNKITNTRQMLRYAARKFFSNFLFKKKFQKKNFREFFLGLFIFRSQFELCLQKFGWSRPAGLGVKGIRTNSSKKLSQIII